MTEEVNIEDKLNQVFRNGDIFNSSDKELNDYLQYLSSGYVPNEAVRHREMNRCQVINTIKTFRVIDDLQRKNDIVEKENKVLTKLNIMLAATAIIVSFFSYWQTRDISRNSTNQIDKLITVQENRFNELINLEKERNNLLKIKKTPNKAIKKDG